MRNRIILNVPPRTWKAFREALLDARQNAQEVIGFLFCRRHRLSRRSLRLVPQAWVVPLPDCYESQSIGGLALRQRFHLELLRRYGASGLDVVHVHTHPTRFRPGFSFTDDMAEARYSRFLSELPQQPRLISGVFDMELRDGEFRRWRPDGTVSADRVIFSAAWLPRQEENNGQAAPIEQFDRQKVFGREFQQTLGRLRVGLVGCGGIGACFAEQLSRLGVRRWVLVDPDHLETTNLNRLPAATQAMVEDRWSKVRYVNYLIRLAWPRGAEVRALDVAAQDRSGQAELAKCDLIVTATDNHYSRMVCQEIALRFGRPLISLGTHIEAPKDGGPFRILSRVTVPPLGGGWCLMCGDVIDASVAALETAAPQIASDVAKAGYVPGVPAPAVYWVNNCCASLGVYVVHGALCGMLDVADGLDWVVDFGSAQWLRIGHETRQDCLYCAADDGAIPMIHTSPTVSHQTEVAAMADGFAAMGWHELDPVQAAADGCIREGATDSRTP